MMCSTDQFKLKENRYTATYSSTSISKVHATPSFASEIWQPSTSTFFPSYRREYSTTYDMI